MIFLSSAMQKVVYPKDFKHHYNQCTEDTALKTYKQSAAFQNVITYYMIYFAVYKY